MPDTSGAVSMVPSVYLSPVDRPSFVEFYKAEMARQRRADEYAEKQAFAKLLLTYRLALETMIFLAAIYPVLVRIRLALSMRSLRPTCLLSLLEVRRSYHRVESAHSHFLSERQIPTFRGVACLVS